MAVQLPRARWGSETEETSASQLDAAGEDLDQSAVHLGGDVIVLQQLPVDAPAALLACKAAVSRKVKLKVHMKRCWNEAKLRQQEIRAVQSARHTIPIRTQYKIANLK